MRRLPVWAWILLALFGLTFLGLVLLAVAFLVERDPDAFHALPEAVSCDVVLDYAELSTFPEDAGDLRCAGGGFQDSSYEARFHAPSASIDEWIAAEFPLASPTSVCPQAQVCYSLDPETPDGAARPGWHLSVEVSDGEEPGSRSVRVETFTF